MKGSTGQHIYVMENKLFSGTQIGCKMTNYFLLYKKCTLRKGSIAYICNGEQTVFPLFVVNFVGSGE
jgi:hypothetical protein